MDRFYTLTEERWEAFSRLYDVRPPPPAFNVDNVCLIWRPRAFWFRLGPTVQARPNEVMWCVMGEMPIPFGYGLFQKCAKYECLAFNHQELERFTFREQKRGPYVKSISVRFLSHMQSRPTHSSGHWFILLPKPLRRRTRYYRGAGRRLRLPDKVSGSYTPRESGYFRLLDEKGRVRTSLELAYEFLHGEGSIPHQRTARTACNVRGCHSHLTLIDKVVRVSQVDKFFLHVDSLKEELSTEVVLNDDKIKDDVKSEDNTPLIASLSEHSKVELLSMLGNRMYDEVSPEELIGMIAMVTSEVVVQPTAQPIVHKNNGRPSNILPYLNRVVVTRFTSFINVCNLEDCWPWEGALNAQGVGVFRLTTERLVSANRVAYVVYTGQDFKGNLHHETRQVEMSCCNPRHWRPKV